jgi:isoaspartyl peptidase/L-asparaginase-like protein (Ntn-hydrolase superfamily)
MTNYCTSAFIVQQMGRGAHPQEACEACMRMMARSAPDIHTDMYCVIAINPRGEIGAASMNSKQPLQYAHWRNGSGTLETAPAFLG